MMSELTFMAVEPIECCVVAVTSVGSITLHALAAVSTRYSGIETLPCTVPPYTLFFVYFSLEIQRNAVHP